MQNTDEDDEDDDDDDDDICNDISIIRNDITWPNQE